MKAYEKLISALLSLVVTVTAISFESVGSIQDVSLQIRDSDLIAYDSGESEAATEPEFIIPVNTVKEKRDSEALRNNTYSIEISFSEDGIPNEVIDTSEFIYDGSSMWTTANLSNIRSLPTVESEILSIVEMGTHVIRLSYGNDWSNIRLDDGTEGYILSSLIGSTEPTPVPTAVPTPIPTEAVPTNIPPTVAETTATTISWSETPFSSTVYATCALNVRSGPDISYSLVTVLSYGDSIEVVAQTSNGWYKTSSNSYVKCSLCSTSPITVPDTDNGNNESSDTASSDFYTYCSSFIGIPYVFGGSTPSGFDCSGFVLYVMRNYYGVSLPHSASSISYLGTEVSASEISVGDVICYDYNSDGYVDHVSVYVGGGRIIHASNSRENVTSGYFSTSAVTTIRRFI